MLGKTNFLVFNEAMNPDDTMSDSNYSLATQRLRGVTPGIAISQLHNKLFRQISAMSKGLAYWVNGCGYDCYDYDIPGITNNFDLALASKMSLAISTHNNDANAHAAVIAKHNTDSTAHPDLRILIKDSELNILQRSKAYAVGDIAYSPLLPSWARLECVKAGTTADVEPQWTNIHGG